MKKIIYRFKTKVKDSPWFTVDEDGGFGIDSSDAGWEVLQRYFHHEAHELSGDESYFCLLGWSAPYPEALRALCCALRVSPPFDNSERETPIPYDVEEIMPNPATLDPQYANPLF
ncbi:MAG: hypothetical protein J6K20_01365 [Thermoguttaceae bacterium]|nr:hypothetical protein [Thermoguttaceae bacterium]